MKRSMSFRKMPALPLPALCALAAAVLWLLSAVFLLAFDSLCYATGRLTPQTVTLADSELYTLEQLEFLSADTLVSTEGDSKLFLTPGQPVRTLRLVAEYSQDGSEKDLYYHLPGQGYSQKLRLWPTQTAGEEYSYTVPFYAGQNLRLDLCDRSGIEVRVKAIVLNEPQPWYSYFVPSPWQLFWLAAGAGLAACTLALIRDALPKRKRK